MKHKIFITGGHLTPALAVIDELGKQVGDWEIFFLGRKHAFEGDKALSNEYQLLSTDKRVQFLSLTTGRLQSKITWKFFVSLIKIPIGFLQALFYLIKYRPHIVLSFGGYLALPVSITAWLIRIPVVTHEQTIISGRTNSLIQLFAKKVFVSWKQSLAHFDDQKAVLTGLPIRKETLTVSKTPLFEKYQKANTGKVKTIWVTGGNMGSHSINLLIKQVLPKLLTNFFVIHQTGRAEEFNDLKELTTYANSLPPALRKNYLPVDYLGQDDIGWVLKYADFVIGRSGINTVVDLMLTGTPAILIPLPWSARNEQLLNANFYASLGAAEVLEQENATPEKLLELVGQLSDDLAKYTQMAKNSSSHLVNNPAQTIVAQLRSLLD